MSTDVNAFVSKTKEMSTSRLIQPVVAPPAKNMITQVQ